jgi:hypothetical protein
MNIQINKKLFTLNEVYSTLNHSTTSAFLNELFKVRTELLGELDTTDLIVDSDAKLDLVEHIELQLVYINKNIRTFEDALLCYETKIYEVGNILGENTKIWLN